MLQTFKAARFDSKNISWHVCKNAAWSKQVKAIKGRLPLFLEKEISQPTSVYFLMVVVLAKDMTVQILVFWVAIDNCDIVCHFLHAR